MPHRKTEEDRRPLTPTAIDRESRGAHGISWTDVAWLMLSDIVGTSVLTFSGVAVKLGWVLTVIFIVGLFPVSFYVSVLMSRTRAVLVQTAALRGEHTAPRVDTMGEVARAAFASQRAGSLVYAAVYGYTLLGQGSYLLVLGTSLQMAFYSAPLCLYSTAALGCVGLLGPIFLVRRLGESVLLCLVNSLLIVVVVIVALAQIAGSQRPDCGTFTLAPGLSFMSAMGAATNVVYAYAGQWMYFELMQTMSVPEDFPRAFAVTGPFMVSMYLVVALVGYGVGAGDQDLVEGMDRGPALRAAAVMLFAHVAIVYLIKSVVLARYFHGLCRPGDVESRTLASYCRHGFWGVAMLTFGYVVANAVPFFSQLLGIIGGLCAGPVNFLLPIVLYLLALGRQERLKQRPHLEAGPSQDAPAPDGGWGPSSSEDTDRISVASGSAANAASPADGGYLCLMRFALRTLPLWELVSIAVIVVFILLTMFIGVADEISQVIELQEQLGAPFSCHALRSANSTSATCPT